MLGASVLPTGGKDRWANPEDKRKLRGMKSTDTHVLCEDGPLHRVKLRRYRKANKQLVPEVPHLAKQRTFTVPPWYGCYVYNSKEDRYQWQDARWQTQ